MPHGLTLTESGGINSVKPASLGDLGIIVTSKGGTAEETATLNANFPINTPILITDVSAAAGQAGSGGGTMKAALTAIAQMTSPVIVLVRVEEGATAAETTANVVGSYDGTHYTGMQALLSAMAVVKRRPRAVGAPGLDTAEVAAAFVTLSKKLRGRAYCAAIGDTVAEISTYRATFASRELTLIDNDTSASFPGEAVARALATRALADEKYGYSKTISNIPLDGVLGLTKDRHFDLLDPTTDAGVLNDADVVTIVSQDSGFTFWGNTTCAPAGSDYAFESAVWTLYRLQDITTEVFGPKMDFPMTIGMAKHLLEQTNQAFKDEGDQIMGAKLSLAPSNTSAMLAAGRPKFQIKFTPCAPMDNPTVDLAITDEFYAGFGDSIAA